MSAIRVVGDGSRTIYQLLQGRVPSPACGGNGTCGKCRVRPEGEVSRPSASEERLLSREDLAAGTRLACLCVPMGECLVHMRDATASFEIVGAYDVPPIAFRGEGLGVAVDIGTTTCVMDLIDLSAGTILARETFLNAQRAWGADVLSRVHASSTGHAEDLRSAILSGLGEGLARLLARAGTVVAADTAATAGTVAAADPAATAGTVAAADPAATAGTVAAANPAATADTVTTADTAATTVGRMVIAANTAMCHFLLGLDASGLGVAPFTPAATSYPDLLLGDLLGPFLRDSRLSNCVVQIIPGISAFIGGDIVAGLAALDPGVGGQRAAAEGAALFVDIGTNAEMVLMAGGKYICASAAAGPAFEGGGISCGTGCVSGAVSSVFLDKNRFAFSIIGDPATGDPASGDRDTGMGRAVPSGLCGSGLLDLIACSLELGLIRGDGSLSPVCAETGILLEPGGTIALTQKDIRAFQLAKAAVRAGIESLLSSAGIGAGSVARVHLAGGFGLGLSERSAIATGLLPAAFASRVHRAGNTSLAGATRYLADPSLFARFDDIMQRSVTLQLASDASFNTLFVGSMDFPR